MASKNKDNGKNTSKVKSIKTYDRRQDDSRKNVNEKITSKTRSSKGRANNKKVGRRMGGGMVKELAKNNGRKTRGYKRTPLAKNKSNRPKYLDMILKAFSDAGKPTTLSRQSILRYICANIEVKDKTTTERHVKLALKWCISNKYLKPVSGQGISGSFALLNRRTNARRHKMEKPKNSASSTETKLSKPGTANDQQSDSPESKMHRRENQAPETHETDLVRLEEEMTETERTYPLSHRHSSESVSEDAATTSRRQSVTTEPSKPFSEIKAVKKYTFDLNTFFGSKNKFDEIYTRAAVTEDGRLFVSDFSNNKVSVFAKNPVVKLLGFVTVREIPRGIVVLNDTEVAVCTDRKCLVLLNTTRPKPKIVDRIKLPFKIRAVTKHRDKLVVTCPAYRDVASSVKLIDKSGTVYWSVSHDSEDQPLFSSPDYICSQGKGHSSAVIVSDNRMKTLTLLNADTGTVVTRRHVTEKEPFGVTTDTEGNVYVCHPKKDKKQAISVFNSDLSKEKILLSPEDGLDIFPLTIVYDHGARELIVAHAYSSAYECFKLLKSDTVQ